MFCTLNVLFYVILHVQVEGTILCADEGLRPLLQEGIRQNNRDGRFCIQGTVKSGNFVTFFAQNIFFHKIL
jgi:hypothetical protein